LGGLMAALPQPAPPEPVAPVVTAATTQAKRKRG